MLLFERHRIRRSGVALIVMGLLLSAVDVSPGGEIPAAFAGESAASSADVSPQSSAVPEETAPSPAVADEPVTIAPPETSPSPAPGESSAQPATIAGTVYAGFGAPLAGAIVTLTGQPSRSVTTGPDGAFRFDDVDSSVRPDESASHAQAPHDGRRTRRRLRFLGARSTPGEFRERARR